MISSQHRPSASLSQKPPMTLIISSIGILFHAPTYDVFVNARQHKKTTCVLFVHKSEYFLVCGGNEKRMVRCWRSQKSVTLQQPFDPGGVHQEIKIYLFQDSEDHNHVQLQFKGRYHTHQAFPSRYLAEDLASIWHCDELLIVPSNGRGCTYNSVTSLSQSKLLNAHVVVIVETPEVAWLKSAYLYLEKRDVRNYVRLTVIIEGRPYARYFLVGSLDMLTGFTEGQGSGIIFLAPDQNLRNSLLYFCLHVAPDVWLSVCGSCANSFVLSATVSDVGLAIEDAHTAFATEFASDAREHVPFPKEEFSIYKEIVQDITLHYLDAANDLPQGEQEILSLMLQLMTPRKIKLDLFVHSIKSWRDVFSTTILLVWKLKFLGRLLKLGVGKGVVHIEARPIYLAISCASICTDDAVKNQYIKLVDVALSCLLAVDNVKRMLLQFVLYSNLKGKVLFEAGGIVVNLVSNLVEGIFGNSDNYLWDPV